MKKAAQSFIMMAGIVLALASVCSAQSSKPLLIRNPTMSKTQIVFSYAGDLWTVPREGGQAQRLTTGIGNETRPIFSPDGQWIAFTGEYDGNIDVYIMPAAGGVPKRLTYHPGADTAVGWTPDGKHVLFVSGRDSQTGRTGRLYTLPVDGVFSTPLPLPAGYGGSYSPDGSHIAYVPLPNAFNAWKRYRGGEAMPIWIANLADSSIERIPREDSNDFNPMWVGETVYFLSDRNGPTTLFSYNTSTKKVAQLIQNNDFDIKSASAGPDGIVYEQFGSLNFYDWKTGATHKIDVTINADMLAVRPKYEKVANRIVNAELSPTGARAVFEAHGEIITVPAEKGDARDLTNTPGIAERDPAWSPDGKWIAYFSDESGEYALHLRNQTGMGEVKKINLGSPPSFYYNPTWSPDSKKIAYSDKHLNLWYVDIEKGVPVKIDSSPAQRVFNQSWSPDSRWIAYEKQLKSQYQAIFIYSVEDGKTHQVTDGLGDARNPEFDKSGKYLYFTGSTDIGPAVSGFDMTSYPFRPSRSIYICVLSKDLPSPIAPESDEEKVQADKAPEKTLDKPADAPAAQDSEKKPEAAAAKPEGKDSKTAPKVVIDFDRIGQRILGLPVPARSYVNLRAGKTGTLYVVEFIPGGQGPPSLTVSKFDLEKRKLDKVLDGVQSFVLSANGEKMLYRQGQNWFIAATAQPVKPGEGRINTDEMEVYVDPVAEWHQMYNEVWRIERDFFYDPNHHGLNLEAAKKRYEPFVDAITDRDSLNYIFNDMLGDLTIGHLYVGGGDMPHPERIEGGLLGADYKIENGHYRFAKIFDGENWNPEVRAPLTQPGVNVQEGDYLLAVRGRNLTSSDNIYSLFEETANKQIVIRVGPNPDGTGARDVTVVPVASEQRLRYLAWVESNRRKVDEMSNGRLAYIHLPDTAQGGYANFNRYYFSQLDKQGAVVDERFNGGGSAADYIIDYLRKPLMSYWAVRDGDDFREPFGTMPGPKAMIINEYAGSGGDYMPWMFRRENIGPLIGKRTWGGLVGIGGYPQLIDGGSVTAPHFGFYSPEGKWEIENHGVGPDIEVEMDPKLWREGRDPQLEKAVSVVLEELKKNPPTKTTRPPFPVYHRSWADHPETAASSH
ncbi:MAG TPA: PDZ domain-containing protein [Blastocatellia bacterium]